MRNPLTFVTNFFRSADSNGTFQLSDVDAVRKLFGEGFESAAGIPVDPDTARKFSAVWQAVYLISTQTASFPLCTYERQTNGNKKKLVNDRAYYILHTQPNPEMTAIIQRETLCSHLLLWGNAYAEIERNNDGSPRHIWLLPPWRVQPQRNAFGQLEYKLTLENGGSVIIPAADMIHVPYISKDGIKGMSVIEAARDNIGTGLAMDRFSGRSLKNGIVTSGVIEFPKELKKPTPEQMEAIRKGYEDRQAGPNNAARVMLLWEGAQYKQAGMSLKDAQFVDQKQFTISDVARWFNIPLSKLRSLEDGSSYASVEMQNQEFIDDTLKPLLIRFEQEYTRKLFPAVEDLNGALIQDSRFVEHNVDGYLRGNASERADVNVKYLQAGVITVNEVRALENKEAFEGEQYDKPYPPAFLVGKDVANEIAGTEDTANTDVTTETVDAAPEQKALPEPKADVNARAVVATKEILASVIDRYQKIATDRLAKCDDEDKRSAFYDKWEKTFTAELTPVCGALSALLTSDESADVMTARLLTEAKASHVIS
jgi:HK97 family phage portal protein